MNIVTSCPKCGADVPTTEMDIAMGTDAVYCDNCYGGLPGTYELIQAERRSMDADPDWQERQGPYESEFNIGSQHDVILITHVDGEEVWRFTADQLDTLLVELELLLIYMRDGVRPDKHDIERAFDDIKAMRARRISAA